MLRIDLRSLETGHHEISLRPAAIDVGLEPDDFRDVVVDVELDYDGKKAFVTVKSSAVATLICDRTVEKFDQPLTGEYSVLFTSEECLEGDEEIRPISATAEEFDITDIVRDTILLSVPARKIAPGAEDVEFPVAFGEPADEDLDPRWEALKALKNNDDDE